MKKNCNSCLVITVVDNKVKAFFKNNNYELEKSLINLYEKDKELYEVIKNSIYVYENIFKEKEQWIFILIMSRLGNY